MQADDKTLAFIDAADELYSAVAESQKCVQGEFTDRMTTAADAFAKASNAWDEHPRKQENRLATALENAQAGEYRFAESAGRAVLRRLLQGALCAECGDPLGDEDCGNDDNGRTLHERCLTGVDTTEEES